MASGLAKMLNLKETLKVRVVGKRADPLGKTYFEDLADNIRIVRERVERKRRLSLETGIGEIHSTQHHKDPGGSLQP